MNTSTITADKLQTLKRADDKLSIFHSEKELNEKELLRSLFTIIEIYKYPEGSKFSGKSEYRATKSGYILNILPTTKGYQVYLGQPGKDVGNVNSFGLIESWFPTNNNELLEAIKSAAKLIGIL